MDKQTREARAMVKDMPLKEKIAHIWLYDKWWIIGITIVLLLIFGTVYEVMTRPTYDLEIGFYSEKYFSDETLAAMEEAIAPYVSDTDGDGEKTVKIYNVSLSAMGGQNSGEGAMAIQTKFMAELSTGAYPVFFFDDYFYEMMEGESYRDTMDSLRSLRTLPQFDAILSQNGDAAVYWGTRALYENEKSKEERVAEYERTTKLEQAIFGGSAEDSATQTDSTAQTDSATQEDSATQTDSAA